MVGRHPASPKRAVCAHCGMAPPRGSLRGGARDSARCWASSIFRASPTVLVAGQRKVSGGWYTEILPAVDHHPSDCRVGPEEWPGIEPAEIVAYEPVVGRIELGRGRCHF